MVVPDCPGAGGSGGPCSKAGHLLLEGVWHNAQPGDSSAGHGTHPLGSSTSSHTSWAALEHKSQHRVTADIFAPETAVLDFSARSLQPRGPCSAHPCWLLTSAPGELSVVNMDRSPAPSLREHVQKPSGPGQLSTQGSGSPAGTHGGTHTGAGSVGSSKPAFRAVARWFPGEGADTLGPFCADHLNSFTATVENGDSKQRTRATPRQRRHRVHWLLPPLPSGRGRLIAPPPRWAAAGGRSLGRPAPARSGSPSSRPLRTSPWPSPGYQTPSPS